MAEQERTEEQRQAIHRIYSFLIDQAHKTWREEGGRKVSVYALTNHELGRILEETVRAFQEYRDTHDGSEEGATAAAVLGVMDDLESRRELCHAGEIKNPSYVSLLPVQQSGHRAIQVSDTTTIELVSEPRGVRIWADLCWPKTLSVR